MPTIERNPEKVIHTVLNAKVGAVHLKSIELESDPGAGRKFFGRLVQPPLTTGEARLVQDISVSSEVIVLGYDVLGVDKFVWEGTGEEFHKTWEVD